MVPKAIVPSNDTATRGVDDIAWIGPKIGLHKLIELYLAQKAKSLRIGAVSVWKVELLGELSNFRFQIPTDRKLYPPELVLCQGAKEVCLIFDRIGRV